jgi:putative transposase
MLRATKVRIYPTAEQADFLNRQFGQVRFVYNQALRIMSHRYKHHGDKLTARHDMSKLLTRAKKSARYEWLKESDSKALYHTECVGDVSDQTLA